MKVKIKDIAEHAGVSTGTVDRVLHNRGRVSFRTREMVRKAMEDLQYKPDILARTLARKVPAMVKILLPYPYQDFYWRIVRDGIEQGLAEFAPYRLNGQVHFYDMNDSSHFDLIANEILEDTPDVVLIGSEYHSQTIKLVKKCHKKEIPCIVMNAEINSAPVLSYIGINTYAVGELVGRIVRSTRNLSSVLIVHTTANLENTTHLQNKELGLINSLEKSESIFHTQRLILRNELNSDQAVSQIADLIQTHHIDTVYFTTSRAYQFAPGLKRLYPDLFIIGHDLIDHHIRLLQNGTIDVLIDQSGYRMGYLAVKAWVDHHVLDRKIPNTQYLPFNIIYPENLPFFQPLSNGQINS